MNIYINNYTYTYTHTYICICVYAVYMHIHICIYCIRRCMYLYIYMYVYKYMPIYTCIYMHIWTSIYMTTGLAYPSMQEPKPKKQRFDFWCFCFVTIKKICMKLLISLSSPSDTLNTLCRLACFLNIDTH